MRDFSFIVRATISHGVPVVKSGIIAVIPLKGSTAVVTAVMLRLQMPFRESPASIATLYWSRVDISSI